MIILNGCKLEKVEIINFLEPLPLSSVGDNIKNDLVITSDNGYLVAATTRDTNVLLIKTTELGSVEYLNSNYGKGIPHSIIPFDSTNQFLVVGESGAEALVFTVDIQGDLIQEVDLQTNFQRDVGFLEYVKIMEVIKDEDENLVYTGSLKQQGEPSKMFIFKTDQSFKRLVPVKVIDNDNTVGYSIKVDSAGNYVIGGNIDRNILLVRIASDRGTISNRQFIPTIDFPENTPVLLTAFEEELIYVNGWVSSGSNNQLEFTTRDLGFLEVSTFEESNLLGVQNNVLVNRNNQIVHTIYNTTTESLQLYETNTEGNVVWGPRNYKIQGFVSCFALKQTSDFGFIVGILARDMNSMENNFGIYLLKMDEEGEIERF